MELLKMTGIKKSFFGTTVLEDVNLHVGEGEVHALLGENGAGKSTLMNILAGVHERDKGEIFFDNQALSYRSIKDSENAGIAFVHQELNIFNDLKVFENIFLGKEIVGKFGKLDKKTMIKESRDLLENLGVDIDPLELADHIDTGKKQLIEIAKAFHTDAKLIILDEPTTALNTNEIEHLFNIVKNMKKLGKSFIFISHKMPEIFEIADKYTVLRNGKLISTGNISEVQPEAIAKDMVGESYSNEDFYESRKLKEIALEVKELSGEGFDNVSFSVRKGEIIGVTGLKGAGCSEVLQTVFGARERESGRIFIAGKELTDYSIKGAMRNKIAMVAANRKENSIIPAMSLLENTYISKHSLTKKIQHIFTKREIENYEGYKNLLNIKAEQPHQLITSLSGGNQQKVILARWLNTDAEVLLFDNPTQGIDVGAKNEIYKLILDLSKQGKTVIVNTLEVPEIQKTADRCIVFYHGEIVAELGHEEINEESVMLYATNAVNVNQQVAEV
jgi:ribose transport system ATP-binding protein